MNIVETQFRPLRVLRNLPKDKEGILVAYQNLVKWIRPLKKHRMNLYLLTTTQWPMVRLSCDNCKRINDWRDLGFRENSFEELYVSFSKSTPGLDARGSYVPEFTGRGPSRKCPEIIMPDLVAPGCNILGSHPKSIPFGSVMKKKENENSFVKEDLFESQKIMTGTSMATPHVAGLFTALLSSRPEWPVARAKSAAITTASSFADRNLFGDEFMFGAGLMQLKNALNPGLVYDVSYEHYME
ncbi:cucumisin-like isoform X2 [Silene latifolia]|uniref:cucumisin-like isoform X2 n=1 Tax=Silene latifolia TaxID=37657 RepID=UPI003D780D8F